MIDFYIWCASIVLYMKHYEIEEKMFTNEEDEYNMKDN